MESQQTHERTMIDRTIYDALRSEGNRTFRDGDTDVVEVPHTEYSYVKRNGCTRRQTKERMQRARQVVRR